MIAFGPNDAYKTVELERGTILDNMEKVLDYAKVGAGCQWVSVECSDVVGTQSMVSRYNKWQSSLRCPGLYGTYYSLLFIQGRLRQPYSCSTEEPW